MVIWPNWREAMLEVLQTALSGTGELKQRGQSVMFRCPAASQAGGWGWKGRHEVGCHFPISWIFGRPRYTQIPRLFATHEMLFKCIQEYSKKMDQQSLYKLNILLSFPLLRQCSNIDDGIQRSHDPTGCPLERHLCMHIGLQLLKEIINQIRLTQC